VNARAVPPPAHDRSESPILAPRAESEALAKPRARRRRAALYLAPGQKLADRYEIVRVIGEGGMGVVYSCRDRTGELLAVKRVVLPESNPEEYLRWFVAEARALAALSHENVVRARDFGQLKDGTPYLVMDLVEGVLWQQLSVDPSRFPLLWTLVDQVLSALAHAHARGIVHGDLKPSNVIVDLDQRGQPRARLFDFGLAKRRRSLLDPRLVEPVSPSEPPTSAGTPGYMAPEQILGRTSEISGATDLYALGCFLYRVLAGRPLVVHETRKELDFHAFQAPARPPPLPGVSPALVDFVLSLLVLEPWRRTSSAAEARRAWQAFRPSERRCPTDAISSLLVQSVEDAGNGNLEQTRRIGSRPRGGRSGRLGRSNRWLSGLLSVRASPLVGRTEQQRALEHCFENVLGSEQRQRAVLLTGPSGVGKSRLAEWLCTELEERGCAVALRGFRPAPNVPRDPLALALAERFGSGGGALRLLPSELLERCAETDLGAVVDWVRSGRHAEGSRAISELAPRLVRVLAALAGARPLVIWLDDLAALAPESWAALVRAPQDAPALSFLLVGTARAEGLAEPRVARSLRSLKLALPTEFMRVTPLDARETSALLRAAHPIDQRLAAEISAESAGIPLEALARLYAAARAGSF
jgi:serine/threonine protein kinase